MEPSILGKNCLETGSMTDEIAAIDLENLRELIVPQRQLSPSRRKSILSTSLDIFCKQSFCQLKQIYFE